MPKAGTTLALKYLAASAEPEQGGLLSHQLGLARESAERIYARRPRVVLHRGIVSGKGSLVYRLHGAHTSVVGCDPMVGGWVLLGIFIDDLEQ